MNPLSSKWMPNPPALKRAMKDGHVGVADSPQGRVYVISKKCPNARQVKRAIKLRTMLELAWVGAIACGATAAVAALAQWSNTF
ncbi:hypothetical protein [Massilia sp. TSP1-1-2]|uniref:hypothetical protein n=1 Tax=Massilia sp. TSP1-1-2 TaxID=2804649 RepID=UPI003CF6F7A5